MNKPEWKSFVFYGLLLIPTFFLCYENNFVFFVVLIAMLLTSVIEIPVYVFITKKPEYSDKEAKCMGEIYGVPVLEEMQSDSGMSYKTRITLNLGGFIIPVSFTFYLVFAFCQVGSYPLPLLELTMCSFLIVLFTYMLSVVKGGVGILVPNYVGIFAIPLGFVLAPSGLPIAAVAGLLIFVPAIIGIIVGMLILLVSRPIEEEGSAFYNIGGIGSFHTIYLISFLALLIGAISVCG